MNNYELAFLTDICYASPMSMTAQKLIEEFDALTIEDKEYVKELIEKIMVEARREEIYENAQISRQEISDGKLNFGTAKDALRILNAD